MQFKINSMVEINDAALHFHDGELGLLEVKCSIHPFAHERITNSPTFLLSTQIPQKLKELILETLEETVLNCIESENKGGE